MTAQRDHYYASRTTRQVVLVTMVDETRVWFDVDKTRLGVNPRRYTFAVREREKFERDYQEQEVEVTQ